uniref:Uncharacterized protein n=1 Tax=Rhizophora mucronata TaxID=61149 RepID=A0A2P2N332_RHIMU
MYVCSAIQLHCHASYGVLLLLEKHPESWFLPKRFKENGGAVGVCCKDYVLCKHLT